MRHAAILQSLQTLGTQGAGGTQGTVSCRKYAAAALFQLDQGRTTPRRPRQSFDDVVRLATNKPVLEQSQHIMVSYNWSHQSVILRVVKALKERGYRNYAPAFCYMLFGTMDGW